MYMCIYIEYIYIHIIFSSIYYMYMYMYIEYILHRIYIDSLLRKRGHTMYMCIYIEYIYTFYIH
jgi:hypothetical protein